MVGGILVAEDRIQLGRVVRALRKELGWNQAKLREVTGLSSSTIWEIETGSDKHQLRDETLDRLFAALGVTSDQVSVMIQNLPPLDTEDQSTRRDAQQLAISMMARCLEEIGVLKKQQNDFKENQDSFAATLGHIASMIGDIYHRSDPPVEMKMASTHSDSGRAEGSARPQDTQKQTE